MPERQFRTPAIILKRRDFGEADRLLTILTPGYGKLDVIAKGARKPQSRKTGHVELFTRADLLIHRGRELGVAAQAEMTAPYLPLRENLARGAYAAYCVELLDRFTEIVEEDTSSLFALLDATLARISHADEPRLAVRFYELRLLDIMGYRPEMVECVVGREDIQAQAQYFSYGEGGIVCPECAVRAGALTPVPMLTLKLLRVLQRSTYDAGESLGVPPEVHDDAERVMQGYVTYLLERRPKSADFLRRVR